MGRLWWSVLLLFLTACGPFFAPPTPTPTPTATPTSTPTPTPTSTPTPTATPTATPTPTFTPTPEPLWAYNDVYLYEAPGDATLLQDRFYQYEMTFAADWLVSLPDPDMVSVLVGAVSVQDPELGANLQAQMNVLLQSESLRAMAFYAPPEPSPAIPNVNITIDPLFRLTSKGLERYLGQQQQILQQSFPNATVDILDIYTNPNGVPIGMLEIFQTAQTPQGPLLMRQIMVVFPSPSRTPVLLTFTMPEDLSYLLEEPNFFIGILESVRYLEE